MNKLVLLSMIAMLFSASLCAQDVIVKKDSTTIKAKITEVNKHTITYKKADYPDGPTFQIKKSKLQKIEYKNGDQTVFEKKHFFKSEKPLTVRDGWHLGLHYTPGMNVALTNGAEPVFANNMGFDAKYYFNNNWGIKTGGLYQFFDMGESGGNGENLYREDGTPSDNEDGDNENDNDFMVSAIGVPLHAVFTSGKRLGVNIEAGVSYFYPLNSPLNTSTGFSDNVLLTAETLLGGSYRFNSKLGIDAGVLLQVDLVNYTGQKNSNNLFTGLQLGVSYKIGK